MTAHRNLGFVAAAATLLAAAPMSAIFERWTWLIQSALAVAVVAAVALLARRLRAPLWGQAVGMVAGLLLALTWLFPSGTELIGIVPTPGTLAHFGDLLGSSLEDMRTYGVKVPDTDPLLFLTVLGIGSVAVVADLLTVGLRRPALAGLPMLAIYSVPVAVYVESVPPVPFVIGAIGYLWLLVADNVDRVRRFGRRFTGDGRDVDVWEASPLAAAGRRLTVVGVLLAVLVPLAVPGMSGSLLDGLSSNGGSGNGRPGQGGSPGRIDLFAALSGQLKQTEVSEMVTVSTTEQDPFYLRFGVADDLRPDGFRVRNPYGRSVRDMPDLPERSGVQQSRHRATVVISDELNMPLLPVYAEPVATQELGSNWLYDPNLQVFFSNRDNSTGKRYSFDYVRSTYTPERLRAAPSLPADHPIRQQQTTTPSVREVNELVSRLTSGERTDYDRVRAVYDYFSADNGFSYQESTEGGTSGQDIVNFLTNKVGFCQQYAASMAWLVRAAGVPARVAFGFTRGSNQPEGRYVLTNRNLHAWTEVYFDGVGWVPFDATPAANVIGSARSDWAPNIDEPDPTTPSTAPVPSGGIEPSAGPLEQDAADRDTDAGLSPAAGGQAEQAPVWPWWLAGGVALLLLLAVPALLRMMLRRRRRPRVAPVVRSAVPAGPTAGGVDQHRMVVLGPDADLARAEAHAAWDELLDTLVDFRVPVDRTETPRATADRLVRDALTGDGAAQEAARLLGRAEERARYARDPLTGGELHGGLGMVRRALAVRADRRTRLVAATLPPSVLLHWRTAAVDLSSRLVLLTGRLRSRLLRWNPRRVLAGRAAR